MATNVAAPPTVTSLHYPNAPVADLIILTWKFGKSTSTCYKRSSAPRAAVPPPLLCLVPRRPHYHNRARRNPITQRPTVPPSPPLPTRLLPTCCTREDCKILATSHHQPKNHPQPRAKLPARQNNPRLAARTLRIRVRTASHPSLALPRHPNREDNAADLEDDTPVDPKAATYNSYKTSYESGWKDKDGVAGSSCKPIPAGSSDPPKGVAGAMAKTSKAKVPQVVGTIKVSVPSPWSAHLNANKE
ncbi:hypothetical protein RhiJN_18471 [Ceratobasidium sp. AG-Ba]|nr:hypothetical protein RhiJN_18471 [Ceratobasidium sp. AG-Ba]